MHIRCNAAVALGLLLSTPVTGLAQSSPPQAVTSPAALFTYLNTPSRAWTMNHICVLDDVAAAGRYTNQEFADAVVEFVRFRWNAASSQADKRFFYLGYISHTLTDLHWPGRIERDAAGKIVRFKTCAELGGSDGIRRDEERPPAAIANATEWKNAAADAGAYLLVAHKDNRPFDEVAAQLRNGILAIQTGREADLLGTGK